MVDLAGLYGQEWSEYAFTCGYSSDTYTADMLGVDADDVPDLSTAYAGEAIILRSAEGDITYDAWPRSRVRYCSTGEPFLWHPISADHPLTFQVSGELDGESTWAFLPTP